VRLPCSSTATPDDFGDLVEYLIGDATTEWGALRIQDGHPLPYKSFWFELGNEQYNPEWVDQVRGTVVGSRGDARVLKGSARSMCGDCRGGCRGGSGCRCDGLSRSPRWSFYSVLHCLTFALLL
jgi:alpha-L-arabinofuranosidase